MKQYGKERPPVVKQAHTSTGLRVSLPGKRIAQTALAKVEGPSSLRTVEVGADSSLLSGVARIIWIDGRAQRGGMGEHCTSADTGI